MRQLKSVYFYTDEEVQFIMDNHKCMSDEEIGIALYRNTLSIQRKRCELGISNKVDGRSRHPLYPVWHSMIARCYNANCKEYKYYGARNIGVCDEWKTSLWNFVDDMYSTYSVGLELDRIDNNGNYEKRNCRWVTHDVNVNNTRRNVYITAFGETKTASEWTKDSRCVVRNKHTLAQRIRTGKLSDYDALTIPVGELK
jgi:hypothetical protein